MEAQRRRVWLWLILLWIALGQGSVAEERPVWSVGVVPQFPARQIERVWSPLLAALSGRVAVDFRLQVAENIPAFEHDLSEGMFDLAYVNPAQFLANRSRYRPLLRDHGRRLQGILVTRADGPIETLAQLEGRRLVFPNQAFAASQLLQRELRRRGIRFTPAYVPDHTSVYLNVALGLYPAGGGVRATLERQPRKLRDGLRILHRSAAVPPHPLVARRDLDPERVRQVQAALLALFAERPGLFAGVPVRRLGPATAADYASLAEDLP